MDTLVVGIITVNLKLGRVHGRVGLLLAVIWWLEWHIITQSHRF